jgi:hypothetical protein
MDQSVAGELDVVMDRSDQVSNALAALRTAWNCDLEKMRSAERMVVELQDRLAGVAAHEARSEQALADVRERAHKNGRRADELAGRLAECERDLSSARAELESMRTDRAGLIETVERCVAESDALHARTVANLRNTLLEVQLGSDVDPVAGSPNGVIELGPAQLPSLEDVTGHTEFPITGETKAIDLGNKQDLANLDRRSRWRRKNPSIVEAL